MGGGLTNWLDLLDRAGKWLQKTLAKKGGRYWSIAVAVLVASILIAPYVDDYLGLVRVRYWLFQHLNELTPRATKPRYVKLLLINDDDYWGSALEGRRPIKRDYLAKLIDKLAAADVALIALDFDVRLPNATAPASPGSYDQIPADYRTETGQLVRSIGRAASDRFVVLPKSIWSDNRGSYSYLPDIFQVYGICNGLDSTGHWKNPGTREFPLSPGAQENISCGYIALPFDMRLLPPQLDVGNDELDSFSLAIARAFNPDSVSLLSQGTSYGSYISPKALIRSETIFSAHDLLLGNGHVIDALRRRPVIVGAHWHMAQAALGDLVDVHDTPIGPTSGAIIHENFAEAMLDGRQYGYIPDWVLQGLTLIFGVVAMVVFAAFEDLWAQIAVFTCLSFALVLVQWLLLQLLGTFFEAFVPLLGLWLHSVIERLWTR